MISNRYTSAVALVALLTGWSCTNAGPAGPSHDWALDAIGAGLAWSISRGDGVTVAVIDSGLDDTALPALRGNDAGKYTWTGMPDRRTIPDPVGHGTTMAGLVAEAGDLGSMGVAPGAKVISITVTSDGVGSNASDLGPAILLAVGLGAQVINLSLGSFADDPTAVQAIAVAVEKGVIVVAAAGDTASSKALFPARLADVIAVQAVDQNGRPGPRANPIGANGVSAPGRAVPVILLDPQSRAPVAGVDSGSSIAAAIVSGSIALLVSCLRSHGRHVLGSSVFTALTASANRHGFFQLREAMTALGC